MVMFKEFFIEFSLFILSSIPNLAKVWSCILAINNFKHFHSFLIVNEAPKLSTAYMVLLARLVLNGTIKEIVKNAEKEGGRWF